MDWNDINTVIYTVERLKKISQQVNRLDCSSCNGNITEEKYDKKVSELCLVCLHPDNDSFQLFKVPFMDKEIKSLFELRRESLLKK